MKTHFSPDLMPDDAEQAPCGTWLGESSELSGDWARVDCRVCHKRKEKIIGSAAAEERAIIMQMGDMANFMRANSAEKTMTTNPTIDGVSRELLENSAHCMERSNYGTNWARELRTLLTTPVVERQEPIAEVSPDDSGQLFGMPLRDSVDWTQGTKLYTAPPQLAELQAENERLIALCVEKDERMSAMNKSWAGCIEQRDELQATIERQAAEIAGLNAKLVECIKFIDSPDDCETCNGTGGIKKSGGSDSCPDCKGSGRATAAMNGDKPFVVAVDPGQPGSDMTCKLTGSVENGKLTVHSLEHSKPSCEHEWRLPLSSMPAYCDKCGIDKPDEAK